MSDKEQLYERINDSQIDTDSANKKKKQCMCWTLILILIAAFAAVVVLVIIFKKGNSNMESENFYSIIKSKNELWRYSADLGDTRSNFPDDQLLVEDIHGASALGKDIPHIKPSEHTHIVKNITFSMTMVNDNTLRARYYDMNNPDQWDLTKDTNLFDEVRDNYGMRLKNVGFKANDDNGFGWTIYDYDDAANHEIISTERTGLRMFNNYVEIAFRLPTNRLFGAGEHISSFMLEEGKYTMWANGHDNQEAVPKNGTGNMYGVHPFIMGQQRDPYKFFGIFFLNSNAQQVQIEFFSSTESGLTYRSMGGVLDIFMFVNKPANEIVRLYNNIIGKPVLPPFWALGWQQAAWPYTHLQNLTDVLQQYEEHQLPLDVLWADIEYMNEYRNFEITKENGWDGLKNFVAKELHGDRHIHFVPIVDAGFQADEKYSYFKEAQDKGAFIKSHQYINGEMYKDTLIGKVWPGASAYLDWYHPESQGIWNKGLQSLYDQVDFDGIWVDMNEVTTLCGEIKDAEDKIIGYYSECPWTPVKPMDKNDDPEPQPYDPDNKPRADLYEFQWTANVDLLELGISLDAYHYDPSITEDDQKYKTKRVQYNTHSLYGIMEMQATYNFWKQSGSTQNKKPFILSRATFAGAGKYGFHWTGDNFSTWESMHRSVSGIMDFNIFGMPFVGSDICGFHSVASKELCARWHQLGAFYPFARNHRNFTGTDPQEPYELIDPTNPGYFAAAKNALLARYSILRYMYTLLFEASYFGGTVIRPLFFEFPKDDKAFQNVEHSFMIGSGLKVTPVMEEGITTTFSAYFPKGKWCNIWDGLCFTSKGENRNLDGELDRMVNVHIREGQIVPFQNYETEDEGYVKNTYQLQKLFQTTLLIHANDNDYAQGTLYLDDGQSTQSTENDIFQYYNIIYADKTVRIQRSAGLDEGQLLDSTENIEEIRIYNAKHLKDTNFACYYTQEEFKSFPLSIDYQDEVLRLIHKSTPVVFEEVKFIQFGTKGVDPNVCEFQYETVTTPTVSDKKVQFEFINKINNPDPTAEDEDSMLLNFQAEILDTGLLNIEINYAEASKAKKRFRVEGAVDKTAIQPAEGLDIRKVLKFPENMDEPFYFTIHREDNPEDIIYTTLGQDFTFSDYYIRLSAKLQSTGRVFGLGQRAANFWLTPNRVYTLWARDDPSPLEDGYAPGKNTYGVHPFYYYQIKGSKNFVGVFNNNANAQDFYFNEQNGEYGMTQITTGGVIDLYFAFEGKVEEVQGKLRQLFGKPAIPPKWNFGWQHSRYGYNSTSNMQTVFKNYTSNGIPLDVVFADIDYMDNFQDFTVSKDENHDFSGLNDWVKEIKKDGFKFVPIVDAGIAKGSDAYKTGLSKDIFIQDPATKGPFVGTCWPGEVSWPDFGYNANTQAWWDSELDKFKQIADFDGIWLDMNELASFCDGECGDKSEYNQANLQDKLLYVPGNRDLELKSLPLGARHKSSNEHPVYEYDTHSLNGFFQTKATDHYFRSKELRTPTISRSSYTGSGKWTQLWLGDNWSEEEYMSISTANIFTFGTFGYLQTGADVCGFLGNADPRVCARWTTLGAFQPFARNHNDRDSEDQDPGVYKETFLPGETVSLLDIQKKAIQTRYSLLHYMYTEYAHSTIADETFYKPVFFVYPDSDQIWDQQPEDDILIGRSLKHSMVYSKEVPISRPFFFPGGLWCNILNSNSCVTTTTDSIQTLPTTKYSDINLHLQGGKIIPYTGITDLEVEEKVVLNVQQLMKEKIGLMVLLDKESSGQAKGELILDDDKIREFQQTEEMVPTNFVAYSFEALQESAKVTITFTKHGDASTGEQNMELGKIYLLRASQLGFTSDSDKIEFKDSKGDDIFGKGSYDKDRNMFIITVENAAITWNSIATVTIQK